MTKIVPEQVCHLGRYFVLVAGATIVLTVVVIGIGIAALAIFVLLAVDRARLVMKRKINSPDVVLVASERDPNPAA